MRDLSKLDHFPVLDDLVTVLMHKTQAPDPLFFRILVSYYFSKVASMMRTDIVTHDRGVIPVNMYAINLATSGYGKGFSTNIIEEQVINQFREQFLDSTITLLSDKNLAKIALSRAVKNATDPDDELEKCKKEYEALGPIPFSFDGGTSPAVKQVRHKALMAAAGSLNWEMDEIGSNLLSNTEVLTTYLELYDVGKVKPKLTKNTNDNKRNEDIHGRTPTNMMLFGTSSKLLDGSKVEEEFDSMLETGYARRCFFGYAQAKHKTAQRTPEQIYDLLTDTGDNTILQTLSDDIGQLADIINFNKQLTMSKAISILAIEYRMHCEERAGVFGDHEEIRKAEMSHRYFKALKLAGTFAFIAGEYEITEDILYNAIKLAEESGEAFSRLLRRDRAFVKLAKYIADINKEITLVDLVEDLPFFKGSESIKRDMMTMAIAYGYKNNIIIKRAFVDGIEFISGESLQDTNLDEMVISYSQQMSDNYRNEKVKFDDLHKLTQLDGFNWASHHMHGGDRREQSTIQGFNLLVIDVDECTTINKVQLLMSEFQYHIYTTKRHTDTAHRFRIVFPMTHILRLDKEDYTKFMESIFEWLPFNVDTSTKDRCRKWLSCKGEVFTNDGKLFDVLPFIPKTSKDEERRKGVENLKSLSSLERWFLSNTGTGNRSNQLIKFALMLVDSGMQYADIDLRVRSLNDRLQDKLSLDELTSTILASVSRALANRASK